MVITFCDSPYCSRICKIHHKAHEAFFSEFQSRGLGSEPTVRKIGPANGISLSGGVISFRDMSRASAEETIESEPGTAVSCGNR